MTTDLHALSNRRSLIQKPPKNCSPLAKYSFKNRRNTVQVISQSRTREIDKKLSKINKEIQILKKEIEPATYQERMNDLARSFREYYLCKSNESEHVKMNRIIRNLNAFEINRAIKTKEEEQRQLMKEREEIQKT